MTNRPIKIRVWNGTSFQFYDLTTVEGSGAWSYDRDAAEIYKHSLDITLNTGLTDKNGREIYEGDIVEQKGQNRGVIVGLREGLVHMHLAEYQQYMAEYPVIIYDAVADNQTASYLESTTVIGNIYSNPDLLTV